MAQYFTDFSEYTTGQQPSDWTRRYAANFTWNVEADASAEGGQLIQGTSESSNDRNALSWDAIDSDADRDDVEVYCRVRFPSGLSNAEILAMARGSGTTTGANCYRHGLRPAMGRDELGKYSGGSYGTIDSNGDATHSESVFYNLRTRVDGSDHKLRVWLATDPEPSEWDIEATDSDIAGVGWVGLLRFRTDPIDIDVFGVGTAGDPAPTSSVDPGTGATVEPTTAQTTTTAPDPTVASGASVTATTATTTETAHDPQVSAGASVQPPAAATSDTANEPTVTAGASVTPTAAATESQALDPSVSGGASVNPTTAETRSEAPAPAVSAGASVSPSTAETVETAYDPIVGSVVTIFPPAAATVSEAPDPEVSTGASVSVPTAETVEQANDPSISTGAAVSPAAAMTVHSANDPTISAGVLPFVRKATIQGTMTRKVTLSGRLERKASVPGILTRKVRL